MSAGPRTDAEGEGTKSGPPVDAGPTPGGAPSMAASPFGLTREHAEMCIAQAQSVERRANARETTLRAVCTPWRALAAALTALLDDAEKPKLVGIYDRAEVIKGLRGMTTDRPASPFMDHEALEGAIAILSGEVAG